MMNITASVGKNGVNNREDVENIKKLINNCINSLAPLEPLVVNGHIDQKTIEAIEEFQRRIVRFSQPDGRVDPNGKTWRALMQESDLLISGDAENGVKVNYSSSLPSTKQIVSPYAISVVKLALQTAGMPQAVITSTIRTPDEQARIMYKNAKKNLTKQFQLYGSTGDEVLKVFEDNQNLTEPEIIKLMKEKIEALLKQNRRTSNHVVSETQYKTLNIFDIGVNSTRSVCGSNFNIERFTNALNELKTNGYIDRVIDETKKSNSCWHIEIEPNIKPLPAN